MIIVEEVAIEGTCRQMSIKLVDSCSVILRDPLMLHQSSSACQQSSFILTSILYRKLLLPATTAVLLQSAILRITLEFLCVTLQKAAIILPATTTVLQSAILRNTNVTFSLWKAPTKNSFHTSIFRIFAKPRV